MMSNICDKCGRHVPPENNAVEFELILDQGRTTYLAVADSRHLLPVVEGGKVVCEGSPSRAQYLHGQPPDTRPGRPPRLTGHMLEIQTQHYRSVFAELQRSADSLVVA